MEKQLRTKRKVVQLNSVNHLREIITNRIAEKKVTKYRAACDMNIQHLTFRNITKESDSGFNVEFLIKIMKYLDIKLCIDNDVENVLDEE